MSKGDLVFVSTMSLVFVLTLSIIILMSWDTDRYERAAAKRSIPEGNRSASTTSLLKEDKSQKSRSGVAVAAPAVAQVKLPIIMYHQINNTLDPEDRYATSLTVSVNSFESQLQFLKVNGYQTVGFENLYGAMYENVPLPSKSVILTFDDGYADNYASAYPLLKNYGFKATFFVISNFIGSSQGYMNADQIAEMSANGMDIESHTVVHPQLALLSKDPLDAELRNSKKAIEKITHKPVNYLAYPSGSYNQLVVSEARMNGYDFAVTVKNGNLQDSSDPMGLLRYPVGFYTNITRFSQLLY